MSPDAKKPMLPKNKWLRQCGNIVHSCSLKNDVIMPCQLYVISNKTVLVVPMI